MKTQKSMKNNCFILMSFSNDRLPVYKNAIEPACVEANYKPIRVDIVEGHFNINKKIIEYLFLSPLIIAEITDKNPNVFYELGISNAIGNKTVMISQKPDDIPFDIRNYRCIIYTQTTDGLTFLKNKLIESIMTFKSWSRNPSNPVQDYIPNSVRKKNNKMKEEINKVQSYKSEIEKLNSFTAEQTNKLNQYRILLQEKDEKIKTSENYHKLLNDYLEKLMLRINDPNIQEKNSNLNSLMKEVLLTECPRGHGPLKKWDSTFRCWTCGWPFK
jgi:hypothetical protein